MANKDHSPGRRIPPAMPRPNAPKTSITAPKLSGPIAAKNPSRGKARTWSDYNDRVSDQDRVIGVRTPEGRYVHSTCADQAKILPPTSKPLPPTVLAYAATRYASNGGLLCTICKTYIVPPTSKKGQEKAQTVWEKANQAYIEGKITKEQWLAAVARYASSKDDESTTPDSDAR